MKYLTEEELGRLKVHVAWQQAKLRRLEAENAAMRATATGLTWCQQCGTLCDRSRRWRKFCGDTCRRQAYNALRRQRYSQARDAGISGREAARSHRTGPGLT